MLADVREIGISYGERIFMLMRSIRIDKHGLGHARIYTGGFYEGGAPGSKLRSRKVVRRS